MSFGLLLPAGLLALLALSIPLLLHLTRRTEQRSTVFAALRWLQASHRPRRQVRFDELLLLALRLLLLALLALLLAQPVLSGLAGAHHWVAVAPGIDRTAAHAVLDAPDADWRWLAPGFPALDRGPPPPLQPTSSLLRELDATLPAGAALTVLVPRRLDGLDGERPALQRKVEWRIVDTDAAPPTAPPKTAAILAVRYGQADDPALPYLRAVAAAWRTTPAAAEDRQVQVTTGPSSEPLGSQASWLVWLAPGALPPGVRDWIAAGGTALLGVGSHAPETAEGNALWRDQRGEVIVRGRALGNGRVLQLTRELTPATLPELLEADFPDRLRALFDPPQPPGAALAEALAPRPGGPALPSVPRPLQPGLAVLVAMLFVAERWLATSPRRGRDA
jgi:hypothetical protein